MLASCVIWIMIIRSERVSNRDFIGKKEIMFVTVIHKIYAQCKIDGTHFGVSLVAAVLSSE
jgi:hypothetical protein